MKEIMFDKEVALDIMAGKVLGKIKTRWGNNVRLLHFGAKGKFPIVGLVDSEEKACEIAMQWTEDGKCDIRPNVRTGFDIVIEVEGGEE